MSLQQRATAGSFGAATLPNAVVTASVMVYLNIGPTGASWTNRPAQQLNLEITRGSDQTFLFTAPPGVSLAGTGAALLFLLKGNEDDPDTAAVRTKSTASAGGMVITDTVNRIFSLTFSHADFTDTSIFADESAWVWGIKLFAANGQYTPVASGTLRIAPFPVLVKIPPS